MSASSTVIRPPVPSILLSNRKKSEPTTTPTTSQDGSITSPSQTQFHLLQRVTALEKELVYYRAKTAELQQRALIHESQIQRGLDEDPFYYILPKKLLPTRIQMDHSEIIDQLTEYALCYREGMKSLVQPARLEELSDNHLLQECRKLRSENEYLRVKVSKLTRSKSAVH